MGLNFAIVPFSTRNPVVLHLSVDKVVRTSYFSPSNPQMQMLHLLFHYLTLVLGRTSANMQKCNPQCENKTKCTKCEPIISVHKKLGKDEQNNNVLDRMQTSKSGRYFASDPPRLRLIKTVVLPQAIKEQYDHAQSTSFSGLFPEINRAYITIDNKIFLWNYDEGSSWIKYDKLPQIIVNCSLVKPRPGVFEGVNWVLVLATPVDVVMLAMVFEEGHVYGKLSLYETQFCVASDNI
eukprot:g81287.t1